VARWLLARGVGTRLVRWVRRAENTVRGDAFLRSGNWHGNRTTWRMCVDLNRCLYYSDAQGSHFDAAQPVRTVLTVIDGVIAGEGEGPLAPADVPLGAVIAATDPVALDLAAVRLMGFDEARLPKIWESMSSEGLRITRVRDASDVEVALVDAADFSERRLGLAQIAAERTFDPHPGWRRHVERRVE
jgi:hypothetical protein